MERGEDDLGELRRFLRELWPETRSIPHADLGGVQGISGAIVFTGAPSLTPPGRWRTGWQETRGGARSVIGLLSGNGVIVGKDLFCAMDLDQSKIRLSQRINVAQNYHVPQRSSKSV